MGVSLFTTLSDRASVAIFYAIALTLCTLVALFLSDLGEGALVIAMFTPLVATLVLMLVLTREGRSRQGWLSLGVQRPGFALWPLAILGPLAVLAVTYIVTWLTGVGEFGRDPEQDYPLALLPVDLALSILIGTVFAFGEELGWRGYLLPKLLWLGPAAALLITGAMQGVWHLPLVLLTDLYHPDGARLIVVPLIVLTVSVAGVFFGYLRLKSGSVWPAAIAHGAFNSFWQLFTDFTSSENPTRLEYLSGETGLFTLIGTTAACAYLLSRYTRTTTSAPAPAPA